MKKLFCLFCQKQFPFQKSLEIWEGKIPRRSSTPSTQFFPISTQGSFEDARRKEIPLAVVLTGFPDNKASSKENKWG